MSTITDFHNCEGCQRKVRNALKKIRGVELVEFDPESGNISVSTGEDPEVIRYILELGMKKRVVLVSQEIVPVNQNPNSISRQALADRSTSNLRELAGEIVGRLALQDLDGVEITHSNTISVKINHRESPPVGRPETHGDTTSRGAGVHIRDEDVYVQYTPRQPTLPAPPWPVVEPSAPQISKTEEEVYGYPLYGFNTTRTHDHPNGCCSIM